MYLIFNPLLNYVGFNNNVIVPKLKSVQTHFAPSETLIFHAEE